MAKKKIADKHWKAIEKVTGMTKEEFEAGLEEDKARETEIGAFFADIAAMYRSEKKIWDNHGINFDPHLFLLWKLNKAREADNEE